ncbi:hypothetical protein HG530_004496 [Fusarium avenaceum]|nr:hypothetical protein HG530_004496 [Fusarium avenaceum]
MEGALALGITRGEDLVDVDFAAACLPAAAVAILHGARDAAVEGPEGGHVAVETALAVVRHLEVEEEDLVGSGETLCVKSANVQPVAGNYSKKYASSGLQGGRNPLATLLVVLVMEMAMSVTMAVNMGGGGSITFLLVRIEVIDGELLQVEWTTNMDRKLVGAESTAVGEGLELARSIIAHMSNSFITTTAGESLVEDLIHCTAEPVAAFIDGVASTLLCEGRGQASISTNLEEERDDED